MHCEIVEKDSFTVMGMSRICRSATEQTDIARFWTEYYQTGKGDIISGTYGISLAASADAEEFEYLIADNYDPAVAVPYGFITRIIPQHIWAIFACRGAMPKALQDVNEKIFSEWLPNSWDYELAADCTIELYTDVNDYPMGEQDANYYSEVWIPVRKK